jgi:hypothetical protein
MLMQIALFHRSERRESLLNVTSLAPNATIKRLLVSFSQSGTALKRGLTLFRIPQVVDPSMVSAASVILLD